MKENYFQVYVKLPSIKWLYYFHNYLIYSQWNHNNKILRRKTLLQKCNAVTYVSIISPVSYIRAGLNKHIFRRKKKHYFSKLHISTCQYIKKPDNIDEKSQRCHFCFNFLFRLFSNHFSFLQIERLFDESS